jgi:hypothetical protein
MRTKKLLITIGNQIGFVIFMVNFEQYKGKC